MNKKTLTIGIIIIAISALVWVFIRPSGPEGGHLQPITCPNATFPGELANKNLYTAPNDGDQGNTTINEKYILMIVVFYRETPPSEDFINQIREQNPVARIIFRKTPMKQSTPTEIENTVFASNLCIDQWPAYAILSEQQGPPPITKYRLLKGPDVTPEMIREAIAS